MRAAPNVKTSRTKHLRESRAVDEGADEDESTLGVVVRKAGLFVELLEREQRRRVDDRGECRESCEDEDGKAEEAVLPALVGWMDHDVDRQSAKGADLISIWCSVISLKGKGRIRKEKITCLPAYHCPIRVL